MKYGVLFDVDGVLVDSYDAHYQSWKLLFDEHHKPFTEEMFALGFGMTTREVLKLQWGEELNEAQIREIDIYKESLYRDVMRREFKPMNGALNLIEGLVDKGFGLAVGSSGPKENVEIAIYGLKIDNIIRPDRRISGNDVKLGKPHPEVFLKAAQSIDLPPSRCVVIEDAPVGIQAARSAGAKSIGLASTGRTREQLNLADFVVDCHTELSPERLMRLIDERLKKYPIQILNRNIYQKSLVEKPSTLFSFFYSFLYYLFS